MNIKKYLQLAACLFLTSMCAYHNTFDSKSATSQARIYVFESDANGFNTKTIFYDNGTEVIAVDAQFTEDLAEKAISFFSERTQNLITYLLVSHPNPDKFNGISVF